jgi:hypothetical protein
MISMKDYIGHWSKSKDWTPSRQANAQRLLSSVNSLMSIAMADGVKFQTNPKTNSQVSGETYGGFRPQDCPQGAPNSSHKEGLAVDIYDPFGHIDAWLLQSPRAQSAIESLDMYFEHPSKTESWSHWSIKRPGSGKRFFYP